MLIRIACSPDADDLFMMRALLLNRVDPGRFRFEVATADTDRLNRDAVGDDPPEVSAMSFAWYPALVGRYQLLPHGGSFGEGYGPVVIASEPKALEDLRGKKVAIPGLTTTAWAVLRALVEVEPVVVPITPPERTFDALRSGSVAAALVIHEGRLTYAAQGFARVTDLGEAWAAATGGLPLPLGGNAIRRDLGPDTIQEVSGILRASIADALADREAAIAWLLARGGALRTRDQLDEYLGMYANHRTLDLGVDGRAAVVELLRRNGFTAPIDFAP